MNTERRFIVIVCAIISFTNHCVIFATVHMICSAHARDIIFVISSQTPSAAVMESNLEIPAPEKSNPLVRLQYSKI